MRLITEWERPAGTPAYTVRPGAAQGPLPAIVVIQEVWGVDEHIRDVADRFAAAGYYVVAPDLYAEDGERPAGLAEQRLATLKAFLAPHAFFNDTRPSYRADAARAAWARTLAWFAEQAT